MSELKPEHLQAIGKAASALRFTAANYDGSRSEAACEELIRIATTLTELETLLANNRPESEAERVVIAWHKAKAARDEAEDAMHDEECDDDEYHDVMVAYYDAKSKLRDLARKLAGETTKGE